MRQIRGRAATNAAAISTKIASHQHENPGAAVTQSGDLKRAVSQALVLRQDNPAVFPNGTKPNTIVFISLEMIVVDVD
jgi:hypothetical protein